MILNKYNTVTEKVVDNNELMECVRRGEPVIYIRSSKDFKLSERNKKCQKRNIRCAGNRYCISTTKV